MAETVKGLNIKLGLDTTELEANIKSLNSNLREQRRDLAAINKNLRFDPSNLDLWKSKQDGLNATIDATKQKLEVQKKQLEASKKALEIGAVSESEFNKLKRSIQYTEADLARLNNELGKTGEKIKALSSIDFQVIGKIGSAFTKYITAPALAAGTAMSALAAKTAKSVETMVNSANKLGVPLEALQTWEYAATRVGSSSNALNKAFIKVKSLLGEIAVGNADKAAEALSLIGLSVSDIEGLDTEAAFNVIRNALSGVKDEAIQTAVANSFFGEQIGSELSPILRASKDELNEWKEEAVSLGLVTSENAEIALSFQQALGQLKFALNGLAMELSTLVLPSLEKVVVTLRDKLIPGVRSLINWWKELSTNTKKVIAVISAIFIAIGPLLTTFSKLIPLIKTVHSAFTAVSGAIKLAGVSIKLSTLGWGALIAILAVLLLQNENFRASLKRIIDVLGALVSDISDVLSSLIAGLMPVITILLTLIDDVVNIIVVVLDGVIDVLVAILDVVMDLLVALLPIVMKLLDAVVALLEPLLVLIELILEPLTEILQIVIAVIVQVMDIVLDLIASALDPLMGIVTIVVDVFTLLVNIVVKLLAIIIQILNPILKIISALFEALAGVLEVVIAVIGVLMGLLEPLINTLLEPLSALLGFIFTIIDALTPILLVLADVIKTVLVPVFEVLYTVLEPILEILTAIIDAIMWLFDKVGNVFSFIGGLFTGESFGAKNTVKNNSVANSQIDNSQTTNNVTINTTKDVDVDMINTALGGAY